MAPDAAVPAPSGAVLDRIKAVVGPKGWSDDPDIVTPLLIDCRGYFQGRTALLVRPADTGEVAAVTRICAEAGIPVVPQGGNTGMCGGATPYEDGTAVLLNLGRMNRILDVDPLNYTMTVEAGVILQKVQEEAARHDRLFPLSLGGEGTAVIGGNLSTNAGGVNVLRYGNARDLVLGLEVVLPDGRVWNGLRRLRKDNTGYDLKHLFIGAEGTLGVVTAAVLKLFPKPKDVQTCFVGLRDLDAAIELLARARSVSGDCVTSFEMLCRLAVELVEKHGQGTRNPLETTHDYYALIEFSGARPDSGMAEAMEALLAEAFEDGLVLDATIAQSETQRRAFWAIRETIVEAQKPEGGSIKHDVAIPVSKVPEFILRADKAVKAAMPGIRPCPFGHIGDGNIHYNITQPEGMDRDAYMGHWEEINRIVHDIVVDMNGSISAEHGIGRLKRGELAHYKDAFELELMRRIKAAFDPAGIMNPQKVL
ncbi:MAG: FAD-binding oxidoreductase [Alphaproteobacteria bacterium]